VELEPIAELADLQGDDDHSPQNETQSQTKQSLTEHIEEHEWAGAAQRAGAGCEEAVDPACLDWIPGKGKDREDDTWCQAEGIVQKACCRPLEVGEPRPVGR